MSTSVKPIIIGIAGTLSSGKDTLAEYLKQEKAFTHRSTGDMLRVEKRKLYGDSPQALLTRADPFANNLRAEKGAGILVELAYNDFIQAGGTHLAISGIRSIGEVEKLHELGGRLIFVDADPKIRFKRAHSRNRDIQDAKDFADFLAQESVESDNIDQSDKTIQNQPAMKRLADFVMYNDDKLDTFLAEVERFIFAD